MIRVEEIIKITRRFYVFQQRTLRYIFLSQKGEISKSR